MPLALIAALGASLAVHVAALFLPDVDLSLAPEAPTLQVELPPPLPAPSKPAVKARSSAVRAPKRLVLPEAPVGHAETVSRQAAEENAEPAKTVAAVDEDTAPIVPPPAVEPKLEGQGSIRFAVYSVPLAPTAALFDAAPAAAGAVRGMEIGSAVHTWRFVDGAYRLQSTMETTGVVALFKSFRIVFESSGRLTANGLQPERFTTWRNGRETDESALFDWEKHTVTLARDGKPRPASDGAQDVLSLHYQLAYVPDLLAGTSMEVATGKKYDRYRFEAVGEEAVEIPAGNYRTLHVRVKTDSTTELWLAQERQLLPVKIRYTDRKGEAFELQAVAIGKPER